MNLFDHRKTITSQHGEDGVISKIFETLGTTNTWCVEFGAIDGKSDSNVWNLIENKKWSAVLIESHPVYFNRLKARFANRADVVCLNNHVSFMGDNRLDTILSETPLPHTPDFLVIDIDGNDYHVWGSLSDFKPRVMMIEYNPKIPADIDFVQPKDIRLSWGSSLAALVRLGKEKGYTLVYAYLGNAFFVSDEIASKILQKVRGNVVHDPPVRTQFFELYDGSVVLTGKPTHRYLFHKKKYKKHPVWLLDDDGELKPARFSKDRLLFRVFKNFIKGSVFYSFLYEPIRRFYGRWWKKKRSTLQKNI